LKNDIPGAVAVRRAARQLKNHEEALAEQELEDENDLIDGARKKARPLHQENITGFHARATNEDDHEFDSQQKKEIQENRERLDKLFRPPDKSENNLMIDYNSESAAEQFQPEIHRLTNWEQPKVRNGFFFPPTPIRAGDGSRDKNPKLLINGTDNVDSKSLSLMPPPPSKKPTKKIAKHALVEYTPKHSLEKTIEPSRTRFPRTKIGPLQNVLRYDINGQPSSSGTDWSTDVSTDLDAPMRSIEEERRRHERKSSRDRQAYVNMTPLLLPGSGNQSPITTWGVVDSTPLVISGSEHQTDHSGFGNKAFSLAAESDRDRAAKRAERELETRSKRSKSSTRKRSRDRHAGSLTPAAIALLEKHNRVPSRQRDAFASALRGSYRPQTRARNSSCSGSTSSKRRFGDHAHNATPLASRSQRK
jgi:protein DGCR14